MALLFIGSTGDQAGQTLVTWVIVRRLLEKGYRLGFFKPFGTQPVNSDGFWTDHDALLFKTVLSLEAPLDRICPYLLTDESWRQKEPFQVLKECKDLSASLSEGKDLLIMMGSRHIFFDDASWPVPDMSLVTELMADFVLVNRFRKSSSSIYSILFASSLLKDLMKGVVINRVAPEKMQEVRDQLIPSLINKGIQGAAVAEDPVLSLWSLREIGDVLHGEVLWGEEHLNRPVGRMTVGSGALKKGSFLFKRVYNKIVFLDASSYDRGTEFPPSSESIAGILLTSGIRPPPQIIEAAAAEKIPLLLAKDDTFAVRELLEQSPHRLSSKDEPKVLHFTELMDQDGSLDKLVQQVRAVPSGGVL
jgi:BioD-like phosphotransacetylase family protein